ncbi:MAG: hypothetical protein OXC02_12135, partial [Rhodobacteraceae bacterium]|nr:hypothetical protein [Paracoccaceae bacterium]
MPITGPCLLVLFNFHLPPPAGSDRSVRPLRFETVKVFISQSHMPVAGLNLGAPGIRQSQARPTSGATSPVPSTRHR